MHSYTAAILLGSSLALLSCREAARRDSVTVTMHDAAGKDLGTLTLTGDSTITAAGRLSGLPPGEHAIHLHTTGRCDPPSFESAGDHWNPTNRQHGTQNPEGPHLGDLPNFTVSQDGSATIQATTPGGTLRGTNALLDSDGAAVVVHAKRDDYKTQPSGDSGDRIACGVVGGG
jgi:superoxide dismutase, Cu-Zn family